MLLAQEDECLRREYAAHEQLSKLQQLALYYKYNRDLPRVLGAES